MQTFSLEKVIARAEPGVATLDEGVRKLILRAVWAVSEVEGPAGGEVQDALARFAALLGLGQTSAEWGPGRVERAKVVAELATRRGDPSATAVFSALFIAAMSDGAYMLAEEKFLDEAASALGLEAEARAALEMKLRAMFYEQVVAAALKDGEVSAGERRILNATRKLLSVPEETAARIEAEVRAAHGPK